MLVKRRKARRFIRPAFFDAKVVFDAQAVNKEKSPH